MNMQMSVQKKKKKTLERDHLCLLHYDSGVWPYQRRWRLTQPSPCIPIEADSSAGQPAVAICASSFLARGRIEGWEVTG